MLRNPHATALVAALALGLAACGVSPAAPANQPVGDQGTAVPAAAAPPSAAPATATPVSASAAGAAGTPGTGQAAASVPPILRITAPLIGGGQLDFAGFAGKPLAIWFWAPG